MENNTKKLSTLDLIRKRAEEENQQAIPLNKLLSMRLEKENTLEKNFLSFGKSLTRGTEEIPKPQTFQNNNQTFYNENKNYYNNNDNKNTQTFYNDNKNTQNYYSNNNNDKNNQTFYNENKNQNYYSNNDNKNNQYKYFVSTFNNNTPVNNYNTYQNKNMYEINNQHNNGYQNQFYLQQQLIPKPVVFQTGFNQKEKKTKEIDFTKNIHKKDLIKLKGENEKKKKKEIETKKIIKKIKTTLPKKQKQQVVQSKVFTDNFEFTKKSMSMLVDSSLKVFLFFKKV
jgi:hypothetical protein